jgi:hypothetical protein
MNVGVAIVIVRDSRAVAQVVIGRDWISISELGDHRIPISSGYWKNIAAKDRDRLIILSRERPNQAAEPTRTTGTPPADAGDRASGARGSP